MDHVPSARIGAILVLSGLASIAPELAYADSRDGAFNRIILVMDTSGSFRDRMDEAFACLDRSARALLRYPEDEVLVISINKKPSLAWRGHVPDIIQQATSEDPLAGWRHIETTLMGMDKSRTDLIGAFSILDDMLVDTPRPESVHVFVWSDLIHDARGSFSMEEHFPWKNLGDGRLYLIGLDDTRMARVWRESMEAHGIQGDAMDSAQMKTWTPTRTERTKIVVQRPNPWPERLGSLPGKLSIAVGALGKGMVALLLFGVLGIGALILLAKRRRTPTPPRRAAARAPTRPQALQTRRSTNTRRGPAGRPPPRLSVH